MKNFSTIVAASLFTILAALPASANVAPADKSIGVGVEVGAPTNINAKFMVGPTNGVVVGIGGGIWYDLSLSLHADYLWHPVVAEFDGGNFSGYVGIGGWASIGDGKGGRLGYYQPFFDNNFFGIGARVPLGVSLAFDQVPVEVFAEVVPSVAVFPGIGVFGQGGIGARFYF